MIKARAWAKVTSQARADKEHRYIRARAKEANPINRANRARVDREDREESRRRVLRYNLEGLCLWRSNRKNEHDRGSLSRCSLAI